jgi:hypothetical protein
MILIIKKNFILTFTEPNCPQLFNDIRNVGGSVIGNLITPLLFGKILYTPKNNATYKLIQKVI